uniref:Uncharacterized protein n=1 Tax=Setaria italica TaxID=4555 RepID=K3YBH2_SETIT
MGDALQGACGDRDRDRGATEELGWAASLQHSRRGSALNRWRRLACIVHGLGCGSRSASTLCSGGAN